MVLFRTIKTVEEYLWVKEAVELYADAEAGSAEARLLKIYMGALVKYQKQKSHFDAGSVTNKMPPESGETFEEAAA